MGKFQAGRALQLLTVLLAACTSATPTVPPQTTFAGPAESPLSSAGSTQVPGSSVTLPSAAPSSPGPTESTPLAPPPAAPTAAADQIDAAMEAGDIDYPTAVLYRIYAVVGDPRLPAEFDGSSDGEDSAPFFAATDPDVELPAEIRALIEPYLLRPTDPLSAFSGEREPDAQAFSARASSLREGPIALEACDQNGWAAQNATVPIKVWARCTGNYQADISAAVAVANSIYGPMTAYMGKPVLDYGSEIDGGDTSIDVYLTNDTACPQDPPRCFVVTGTALGQSSRDGPYGESAGMPSSGWVNLRRGLMRDPDEFRRLFIHEFFHILQFAHNSVIISRATGKTDKNGQEIQNTFWFVEASAKWAEYHFERQAGHGSSAKTVHRDSFVNGYQTEDASLNAQTPKLRAYDAYIWPFFMVQETNEKVIADVWSLLSNETDWYSAMNDISVYLPFATHFRDFAVRNININVAGDKADPIKKRYQQFDPQIPFPDGKPFPETMWHNAPSIEPTEKPVPQPDAIKSLSAHYWHYKVDDSVKKFEFDFSGLGDMSLLDVDALLAIRQDGPGSAVVWEQRPLSKPKAKFCRSIPEEDVAELYLVLSNHEMQPLDLSGQFTVHGSLDPCRGYEVTIVRETTGGPWDPTKLTLTAVLEPDEEGTEDGVLEARGRGVGNYLGGDMQNGCKQFGYNGVIYMNAQVIGDALSVNAVPEDPFFLDFFGGEAPEKGGTTTISRPPVLGPGEQGSGIPSCYDWSRIVSTLTVKPLQPEP
jgi:hypothetical protein